MNQGFLHLIFNPPPTRRKGIVRQEDNTIYCTTYLVALMNPTDCFSHVLIPASPGGNFQKQCKYKDWTTYIQTQALDYI